MKPDIFYTIYKITNIINQKYYIGKHKTLDLNDGYMGSGKLIKKAIAKYGIENFKKEILFVFTTEEEMNKKETELVVICKESYNICEGGKGGFSYINKNKLNIYGNNGKTGYGGENLFTASYSCKDAMIDQNRYDSWISKISKSMKEKLRDGKITNGFKGKTHSAKTKKKMKEDRRGWQTGIKNSQYGTMWITNGLTNMKIKKSDLDKYLKEGYRKGRVNVHHKEGSHERAEKVQS